MTALGDHFVRTVSALRSALPFERAELTLLLPDAAHALTLDAGSTEAPAGRRVEKAHYSPRLWPAADDVALVGDAAAELDAAYEADRLLVAEGAASVLALPLCVESRAVGLLTFSSRAPGAFTTGHAALARPLADLLAVAADHERRWAAEQLRQARREKLEALLPRLAEALDVRQVFLGMSPVIQEIVPHDILAFALLSPDRGGVTVQAATHAGLREMPEYRFSNEQEALDANWRFLLATDLVVMDEETLRVTISPRHAPEPVQVTVKPGVQWTRFVGMAGVRSTLRVPIRAKDRPLGGVAFMSRQPYAYDEEDGLLALRIADHVALSLAHQELAEEERKMARAEERALRLQSRVEVLARELDRFSAHRALGRSPQWKKALADATQVADTETTVLVTGESGTGKEVVARFIHRGSPRASGPFVAVNCAALPEQLLESELFGHEKGAFTGAVNARPGRIEQASGGVLFLDEVGEMAPPVQAKFLRVLQEREFQRLGGTRTLKADIRVVAATNRDPRRSIQDGAFREDLYYRLSAFEIHLPPLRERPEDVLVLAQAFLEELGRSIGRPAAGLSEDARDLLLSHAWPGNVRELRNAIERAVILCQGGLVTREHLPVTVAAPDSTGATAAVEEMPAGGLRLEGVERDLLQKALAKARNNKSRAAKLLGLSRGQLYSLLRRHGLTDARR
jgi:transcriptional regulator with GAF, ATPase, and Fis domain